METKAFHGLLAEAVEAIDKAQSQGITLRLLGGLAIQARCPSSSLPPFLRTSDDMDFATLDRTSVLESFFASLGWTPEADFNLYNGSCRLIFHSPEGTKADIFVGGFSMCHRISFESRLALDSLSLPLAELLLTKLQVFEANGKDLSDSACLLADHEIGSADGEFINADRIASVCRDDWGLWRSSTRSLAIVDSWARTALPESSPVFKRIGDLLGIIERSPKGPRWKARALVGERLRWYELPEEAER